MIESENELNNYQCIFNNSELNMLNHISLNIQDLTSLILVVNSNLESFQKDFDNLVNKHSELKHYCRELEVNFIENKIYTTIAIRETYLCGLLINFLYCDDILKPNIKRESGRLEQDKAYFNDLIKSLFPDDSEKVYEIIYNQCSSYLDSKEEDIDKDVMEKQLMKNYISNYSKKEQDFVKISTEDHRPSIRMLSYFFTKFNIIIEDSLSKIKHLDKLESLDKLKKRSEQAMLIELLKNNSKLGLLNDILFNVFAKTKDDLFDKICSHQDWIDIKPKYNYYLVESKEIIHKKLEKIFDMIIIGNAGVNKSFDLVKNKMKFLVSGFYFTYYFINKDKARHTYNRNSIQPNFNVGKQVWNLLDTKGIKTFSKIGFPLISKRNTHILSISYKELSVEDLNELLYKFLEEEMKKKERIKSNFVSKSHMIDTKNDMFSNNDDKSEKNNDDLNIRKHSNLSVKENIIMEHSNIENYNIWDINNSILIDNKDKRSHTIVNSEELKYKSKDTKNKSGDHLFQVKPNVNKDNNIEIKVYKQISLKFLSSGKNDDHIPNEYFRTKCSKCCCCSKNTIPLNSSKPGNLIVHIHGGGFVAMSSSSHENYLRKWANKLECPIISIDYSLSPEAMFPTALNEIYHAYLWIVENSGIKINKLIVAGDSAGGNFALSLTNLLIVTKKRIPDMLILAYPAVHLSMNCISPSTFIALEDVILPYALLKCSLDSYLGAVNGDQNYFASPGLIQDDVLKYLPMTHIYLGSNDPLRDQSLRFASRLA